MFVLCYTVVWNISDTKDEKDLIQYKNGSKEENPGQTKKNHTGGMDVCVVFVVRTVIWNVK
jgi:hypothetical protein